MTALPFALCLIRKRGLGPGPMEMPSYIEPGDLRNLFILLYALEKDAVLAQPSVLTLSPHTAA